jgi:hypothetical protein
MVRLASSQEGLNLLELVAFWYFFLSIWCMFEMKRVKLDNFGHLAMVSVFKRIDKALVTNLYSDIQTAEKTHCLIAGSSTVSQASSLYPTGAYFSLMICKYLASSQI